MKKVLLILLCLELVGCATVFGGRQLQERLKQLESSISDKDEEIKRLRDLLREKEEQLQAKNEKIEQLRKKLESVGVFTK